MKRNNIENNAELKENAFRVPAGYFENLEATLNRIPKEHLPEAPRKKKRINYWAAAAAVVVLMAAGWLFKNQSNAETNPTLNADDIAALAQSGFIGQNDYALLELFSVEELDAISLTETHTDYLEFTQPDLAEEAYLYTDY